MTHDLPVCTLMHVAIRCGTVGEIVTPRRYYDFAIGDLVCFREFDEVANHYTRAEPVMVRIVGVRGHGQDFAILFALLKPAATRGSCDKIGAARVSVKTFGAPHRVRSSARARKAKPKMRSKQSSPAKVGQ